MTREIQSIRNTLEVPVDFELGYTRYWEHFRDTSGLVNMDYIYKTCRLGSYLRHLTQDVVLGNDVSEIELMPDIQNDAPQAATVSNAIAEWDRVLGSRNSLEGAQPDLLRAAGLLLYANFTGEPDEFVLPTTDSEMVYDHFMSVLANNALERQRPGANLLLTGQLIHKAAWKEQDPGRQEDLFKAAVRIYDQIHDNPDEVWKDRLIAGQYRSDIHFQWLSQEMRMAVDDGDKAAQESLRYIAIELLQDMATDFQQAGRLVEQADANQTAVGGLRGFEWAGFMLESFALLAARDLIYLRLDPREAVQYSVRRAFRSEDEPRTLKIKPKQSFDIVVQFRAEAGNIVRTTPIQFKLLKSVPETEEDQQIADHTLEDKEAEYGDIPLVGIRNINTKKMIDAADNLLVAYADQQLLSGSGPLSRVQDLFSTGIEDKFVSVLI